MVTVYDVPPEKLIMKAAEKLKQVDAIAVPEWAEFVKTGRHTENAPVQEDWWFIRAASVMRKVYTKGPMGTSRLAAEYGGFADRGLIPYIGGEEVKSEREPLKVWGELTGEGIISAQTPVIAAQCLRVPVSDGHIAAVSVRFDKKPSGQEILEAWRNWETVPQQLGLPSAPTPFLRYFEEADRPQPRLDKNEGRGMAVTVGRLREDPIFDWRFVALSHNTLRGAAGGGVLTAELLCKQGWIKHK